LRVVEGLFETASTRPISATRVQRQAAPCAHIDTSSAGKDA
jgi:hypothetical protein